MKYFSTALLVLLLSSSAFAKPHQLTYVLPVTDCDGEALAQADLIEQELIYSLVAMSMPSDTDGPCAATADPDAPAGAISVPIPAADTSVVLNLQPGQTYFARIRISAYVNGNWSSWSDQVQFTVPFGRPNKIIMSKRGIGQWEYHVLETTELKFAESKS
jgi:hypothetical protein